MFIVVFLKEKYVFGEKSVDFVKYYGKLCGFML